MRVITIRARTGGKSSLPRRFATMTSTTVTGGLNSSGEDYGPPHPAVYSLLLLVSTQL